MEKRKIKFIAAGFILFSIFSAAIVFSLYAKTVSAKAKYKLYKNTTYGFSIEYPVTWRIQSMQSDEGLNLLFDYGKELISIPDQSTAPSFSVAKTSNSLAQEVQNAVEMTKANIFGSRDIKLKVKNTKIGKIKAKQMNHLNSFIYDRDMELVTVMFVKDGYLFSIGGPAKDAGVKHLVASFKFISKEKKTSRNTTVSVCANEIGNGGETWLRKNCGVEDNGGRTTAMWDRSVG